MGLTVNPAELGDDAAAFDRIAAVVDDMVAHLWAPTMAADALAGPELRPAELAFEELWQRCSRDLTALAESVRHLSATVRSAGDLYERTDQAVATDARRSLHLL